MAPISKRPVLKQQSLSKFFTPKAANGLAATPDKAQSQAPPPAASTATRKQAKRSREAEDSSKPAKRSRAAASRRMVLDDDDEDYVEEQDGEKKDDENDAEMEVEVEERDEPGQGEKEAGRPAELPPSSRTDQYRYSADSALTTRGDEEMAGPARREMHRKFVAKLGNPDALPQRMSEMDLGGAGATGEDDGPDEDDEDAAAAPPPPGRGTGKKKAKLTPMETQFLAIKRLHLDTVLIVEVGYKFRFFGEDARIAARVLSIVCIPGKLRYDEHPSEAHLDKFASASIPVHRLHVHARRLVAAGHKIGVVRQVETAALKKAGDNRNAPFERRLTNLYTKGTYIDDEGNDGASAEAAPSSSPSGGYLLCITETACGGSGGADERVRVGIVAVQPATGDIIYDDFQDGFMRAELETRLLHIAPCEFLVAGDLTAGTDKLIRHLSGSSTNVFGDRSRVERVGRPDQASASSQVTQFYTGKAKQTDQNTGTDAGPDGQPSVVLLDKILHLPESVTICLASMISHLAEYGLEHVLDLTKYFTSFTARSHMLIGGTTLESLEVYRNTTDRTARGSLFWALDRTATRPGRRLLRRWIGSPLLDRNRLEERVDAVEELVGKRSSAAVSALEGLLKATARTDLERGLVRVYYGKCSRPELLSVLQKLQTVGGHYPPASASIASPFDSPLLVSAAAALPPVRPIVLSFLDRINADAARRDDKYGFFREGEETKAMTDHRFGIAAIEQELDGHRAEAARQLGGGGKKAVEYVAVSGVEYLIEVANADVKRVPASWAKISGTRRVSRFHTPEVVRLVAERDQHREALAAACDAAYAGLLRGLAAEYQPLRDAVVALSSLDCLLSLSRVAALPGYSRPVVLPADAPPSITVEGGRHPVSEHILPNGYIPFSATLGTPGPLAYLITGPNMGGKSSFVRAVALLVLLAQVGSFVPADRLTLTLCDAVYTRMGARDNLFAGESTFMVEVSETGRILRSATPRSLVILDELGRGTSTHDGAAIAHAVLDHVARDVRCLTLFITHYQNLARVAAGLGDGLIKNVHMRFEATRPLAAVDAHADAGAGSVGDADGGTGPDEEITFLYEVAEGIAHRSYGLNVARLAGLPRSIINLAAQKSVEMEAEIKTRMLRNTARLLGDLVAGRAGEEQLDHLISSIQQL